ncbi:MAG: phosphatase PAP2 family protein [Chitinophagaceae bacterium]
MIPEKINGDPDGAAFYTERRDDFETEDDRVIIPQPLLLKIFGQLFSYLFHPLFIPGYVTAFLLYIHPYAFAGFGEHLKMLRLISVVLLTAFFPAFSVFLLNRLGFADSIFLKTRKERIIPYIISMFFYFWIFYVSRNLQGSPSLFVTFLLGLFISSIAALMANIYFKVSMHGIAMGVMMAFFVMIAMEGSFAMGLYLSIAVLIAGLVCTSRMIVSNHYPFEIYVGFLLGVFCELIALVFT